MSFQSDSWYDLVRHLRPDQDTADYLQREPERSSAISCHLHNTSEARSYKPKLAVVPGSKKDFEQSLGRSRATQGTRSGTKRRR